MSYLISGTTITDAWLKSIVHLSAVGRQEFDLVVDMYDPIPSAANVRIVAFLDELLGALRYQTNRTVANTIFPAQLARTSITPERLFHRYLDIYPKLRRQTPNNKGTYFGRLLSYSLRENGVTPVNQLELIIGDLRTEIGHRGRQLATKRHLYEAQIFAPGRDRRPMGFPCMSSLSFHIDGDNLRLTATYRNQYYIERALGNFQGLAELQQYVARHVGLLQGPLTVHAFHAEIEPRVGLGEVASLIHRCNEIAIPEVQGY